MYPCEPRWQKSSKTWSSSLPTNASKIYLQMEQFSHNTGWTLAEDLRTLKRQEDLVQLDRDEISKEKGSGTGSLCSWEGSWKRGEVSASGNPRGKINWDKMGALGSIRGGAATSPIQQAESETYTDGSWQCAPPWDMCLCSGQGLGDGTWGLESKPGRRLLLSVRKQPEGSWSEEIHNQECSWRKPGGCHRSKLPLLSDT